MRRIVVFCKAPIEQRVPLINLIYVLQDLYDAVTVLVLRSDPAIEKLYGDHVQIIEADPSAPAFILGRLRKLQSWRRFRQAAREIIRDHVRDDTPVWISNIYTAMAMGPRLLGGLRYVFQIQELYDDNPWYLRAVKRYAPLAARMVVPEEARAAIYRVWCGLSVTPAVLPNKPVIPIPSGADRGDPPSGLAEAVRAIEDLAATRRLVLFHGHIEPRRDVRPLVQAVGEMGPPWAMVTMGRESAFLKVLRDANPDLLHVPFLPAPWHLEIVKRVHIGAVGYPYETLNNVFCAPNKTWELAGQGVPILAEAMPSILSLNRQWGFGETVDMGSPESIQAGLRAIDQSYDRYTEGAARFHESVDVRAIVGDILDQTFG